MCVFASDNVFIASSIDPANDVIENFVHKMGVHIYRGNENNVAGRFLAIIGKESPDYCVRLNADSPLLDHRIISNALDKMTSSNADIVSTAFGGAFPSGMNVEVFRSRVFQDAYHDFEKADHFEHVTKFFYENSTNYNIESIPCPVENPRSYKFTFDTPEDAKRLETFFNALQLPHYKYTLAEKCQTYRKLFKESDSC
jgi:spore coat polysaccharide biosynthesis protein SpsF